MDETKQDDKTNWGQTGSLRVHTDGKGEIADILRITGHAYQVVYSQKSTWVFYLRFAPIDGDDIGFIQCILRPGPDGVFSPKGTLEYVAWDMPAPRGG